MIDELRIIGLEINGMLDDFRFFTDNKYVENYLLFIG